MFSLENWPEMDLKVAYWKNSLDLLKRKKLLLWLNASGKLEISRSPSTGFRAPGLKVWGSGSECTRGLWPLTWAAHHRVGGWQRKRKKKENPLASSPEKKQEKAKIHKTSIDRNLKEDKTFLSHFYGNIGTPQWNEQFLRKTKCIQVNPSRNRKLLPIPIEEIGKFSRP